MRKIGLRRSSSGFTLMEVALALVIFTLMALLTAAVVPMSARSVRYGNDYTQAATLVSHKVNQLQEAGYSNLNRNLANTTYKVVDSNGTLPTTTANVNGTQSGSADFTTVDGLNTYFVGGVSDPKGTITISPFAPSRNATTGAYSAIEALVTVTWRDVRGRQQSYSSKTFVTKMPLL
ncbi:MAG: prepilin-type N-terminal cleavage/methylation domain-containing protein [Armatimonas sp.]